MAGLEIIFPVSTVFNLASADKTMADINSSFSKAAQAFKLDMGSLRGGENLVDTMLGGKENFTKMIDESATGIGKLSTTFANVRDKAGNVFQVQTGQIVQMTGVLGGAQTITKNFAKEQANLNNQIKKGEWVVESYSNQVATMTANQRFDAETTKQVEKELVRYTEAADKLDSKLKNMRGSQVNNAKNAVTAVRNEIKVFQDLASQGKATKADLDRLEQTVKDMNVAFEGTKAGANMFQNFSNRIGNAIQQTIAYSLSIGLVYKAQQLLNDAVRYAIDLNTEMVKIQVLQAEGAKTPEEINALAQSFNQLGQEMGASTLEIARGSVEWFRQGRTVEETQKLMRASMMLSKLGAMESADATNYLTSITNAFKIEVSDTASVVDKLIAVDNIAATSAGELATALRYTSETAALAGVSMEQLISYIGTVSTVTRQNAEMIGQAFKTMFSRMTLMSGGGTDEEGWTISKVEKALKEVQIEVRNTDDSLKPMGDILETIAGKWETLTDREKTNIATAVAGVRQREAFLVLMTNMDKAMTYQAAQTDAAGLAMDRYGIYLESVQAKQGKLTASMQELYASVVNSKMVSAFYDIAIGIVQTITQGKLLIPILGTILFLIIEINRQQIGLKFTTWATVIRNDLSPALTKLIGFLKIIAAGQFMQKFLPNLIGAQMAIKTFGASAAGLQGVLASLGITISGGLASVLAIAAPLALAIGAITIAYKAYKKGIEETKKAQEEAFKVMNDYANSVKEQSDTFTKAESATKTLKDLFAIPEAKRTEEDLERINQSFKDLYEIMPYLKEWKFANGDPYLEEASFDASKLNDELEKTTQLTQEEADKAYSAARDSIIQYRNLEHEIEILSIKKQAYSVLSQAAYSGEIKTAEDAKKKLREVFGEFNLNPRVRQQLWDEISESITDESSWGKLDKDFGESLENMANTAGEQLGDSEEAKTILENSLKKLLSRVMADLTPLGKDLLAKLFGLDAEFFENAEKTIEADAKKLKDAARIDKAETDFAKEEEERLQRIKDANDLYDKQLTQINLIANGIQGLKDITKDSTKTQLDFDTAVSKFVDEINSADIQGLSVTLDDFKNKQTKAFDIEIIKKWGKEHLNNAYIMNKLKDLDEDLYNSIVSGSEDAKTAIDKTGDALTTLSVKGIGSVQVTADQLQLYYDQASQALWNAVGDADNGLTVTTTKGTQLTLWSAQQIAQAMADGLVKYESFAVALTQLSAAEAAKLVSYMQQLLKTLGSGFVPKVPTFGGGGGGGGGGKKEDPRIKELDRLIELEEDEIEKLEDQIEQYERQKEAIDRLIAKEERKKELIDRQIAIYEEQIDHIDRQIELYERQKDAIDKLIDAQEKLKEPLEAELDALDERLDRFNDYIDAQKESLERMKEEEDYVEELEKKHRNLSKTKTELALAVLDDSEEGQRRRLELEEQLSKDEEDLAEFTEERKYELQIRALEDAQKAFEDFINTQKELINDQIDLINDQIKQYEDEKEAIDALIDPLEAQKLALEDLIYPLEEQKEAIDLIIQGYEDEKLAIDALIQPIQDQIQVMRDRIEVWQEEKEAIQEAIDALGGSGGGTGPGLIDSYAELQRIALEALGLILQRDQDLIDKTGLVQSSILGLINKFIELGDSAEEAARKAEAAMEAIAAAMAAGGSVYGPGGAASHGQQPSKPVPTGPNPDKMAPAPPIKYHEGGVALEHGKGEYKGVLKESEVFAKLLKGEYVATEDQMKAFLKKTLPNIAIEASRLLEDEKEALKARARARLGVEPPTSSERIKPPSLTVEPIIINGPPKPPSYENIIKPLYSSIASSRNNGGDVNVDMTINVEGSLDATVLPTLKKAVIKEINKSLEKRGIRRTADNFAI